MSNPFEDQLKQDLGKLPDEMPPEGHLTRFEARLQQVGQQPKSGYRWMWMAAVLLPLVGLGLWYYVLSPETVVEGQEELVEVETAAEPDLPPHLAEVEQYFEVALSAQKEHIATYNLQEGDAFFGFVAQLDTLEKNYESLKEEMVVHGQNPRVQASLIQNFRLRMQVLETLLKHLESSQNKQPQKNEDHKRA